MAAILSRPQCVKITIAANTLLIYIVYSYVSHGTSIYMENIQMIRQDYIYMIYIAELIIEGEWRLYASIK